MEKQQERKPFFSIPWVRKIFKVLAAVQFTLATGALIAAVAIQPGALATLVILWGMVQLGFLGAVGEIYLIDRFRIWVEKNYTLPQQVVIWIALTVVALAILRILDLFRGG